jgi:xylulose-5-phosphate/fructose-6-phosphate phosphoketolase
MNDRISGTAGAGHAGDEGHAAAGPRALDADTLASIDAWWRAANYLSAAQIYLLDNPLLDRPLALADIKPRLLGHWGTCPGLNLVYAHLNRTIRERDQDTMYVTGPGHGGPALLACTWLEGTYSELNPDVPRDREGMRRLCRQFSFPRGVPSHAGAETPGSINEGGELGYSLSHAFGAAFDNPDLVVACVVGDGEAETAALSGSWQSIMFLDPAIDGAVLPILHLNGYKIANPTVLARMPQRDVARLFEGHGYEVRFVEGDVPAQVHRDFAAALDDALDAIARIQRDARAPGAPQPSQPPRWPLIVLRTPKGWTGPAQVDGKPVEGTWRSHQVPINDLEQPAHLAALQAWLESYRPRELFDEDGRPRAHVIALAPQGPRRMGANPHANGGLLLQDLLLPDFRDYAVEVKQHGARDAEATRVLGTYLRDVMRRNEAARNFRVVCPDELASNRLDALLEVTNRAWMGERLPGDDHLAPGGRVMEVLSELVCEGWLEGYLLTGRHGLFACYEAFIHIVDSMFSQHAKWLDVSRHVPWRRPIASLNYLLTSHVWRQDHNGFSHQDPGFLDVVLTKKPEVVRAYLPPDANTLLCVADRCLRERHVINVIVAGKNEQPQWLDMAAAIRHCDAGIGIWEWASNDTDALPDVVMACCGDVPTIETMAAVDLMRELVPDLRVRVVNVVDLTTLPSPHMHPHGLSDEAFDRIFTEDRPVIFAFHGYPWLIHRLTYKRHNQERLHVRGYKEEGSTTTPFDMTVQNDMDRFRLVLDAVTRVPRIAGRAAHVAQRMQDRRVDHAQYIVRHGEDMPQIRDWRWRGA